MMQHRMKTHPLTKEQIDTLLSKTATGSLATLNEDGTPYVTPVHYLYYKGALYIHGLPQGQKVGNIRANPSVSMTVYEMDSLLLPSNEEPCDTNTKYQSVIVSGKAAFVEAADKKEEILLGIVKKYTPQLSHRTIPENMVKGTAVIEVEIEQITGKYYD